MLIFTKKDIKFTLIMVIAVIISIATPITLKSYNNNFKETMAIKANNNEITIVVDAGHGEPDGGAVSNDGVKESTINLQIAKKLEEALIDNNFNVIMTRETEENIADSNKQDTVRNMKVSDINNRIEIANNSGADFLISIHMNKFSNSRYRGWQTFYSKNSKLGQKLAVCIQEGISQSIDIPNNRTALKIEGIKLVDKAEIPTVIVECGFLSNDEEKRMLQTDIYQDKLVEAILNGIFNYLEN